MLPFDPKKPLYGFTARAPHAWRRIHLFADNRFAYFRPKNAPDDWMGAFVDEPGIRRGTISHQYLFYVKRRAGDLIRRHKFFRVFLLPDPRSGRTQIWQIFWHPELVYVAPQQYEKGLRGAFCWPRRSRNKISLWNIRTEVIRQHFVIEWNDPQSDVRAALPWCVLTVSPVGMERSWQSIKWLRGGRYELETILRAAYISGMDVNWPEGNTCYINLTFLASKQQVLGSSFFDSRFSWVIDLDERLTKIINRLCERNYGVYDLSNGDRSSWIGLWKRGKPPGNISDETRITLVSSSPTQHERMEASLLLREWLRDKAPDLLPDWFPEEV